MVTCHSVLAILASSFHLPRAQNCGVPTDTKPNEKCVGQSKEEGLLERTSEPRKGDIEKAILRLRMDVTVEPSVSREQPNAHLRDTDIFFAAAVDLMATIKRAIDLALIMHPGKVINITMQDQGERDKKTAPGRSLNAQA